MKDEESFLGAAQAFPSVQGDMGLTKREYFAAMALQTILSGWILNPEEAAEKALSYADALIKELEK